MRISFSVFLLAIWVLTLSAATAQPTIERMQFEKMGDAYELAFDGTYIFAATDSGIFRLSGDNWQRLRPSALRDIVIYRIAASGDGNMIGFGTDKIVRTTNGGSQWTVLPETVSGATELIDIIFTKSGSLLLCSDKGVRRSTDLGDSWKASNTGLSATAKVLWIASRPDGELFCSQSNFVFRSQDDGISWTRMNSGLADGYYGMTGIGKDTIYLGGPRGVYRSTNNGETWRVFNLGDYSDTPATSVLVDAQGRLFATTWYDGGRGGAYVSTDAARTWTRMGATSSHAYNMLLDEESRLLVATSAGVYRTAGSTLGVTQTKDLEQCYITSTTRGLMLDDQTGRVVLVRLFDISGRELYSTRRVTEPMAPHLKGVLLYTMYDSNGEVVGSGSVSAAR